DRPDLEQAGPSVDAADAAGAESSDNRAAVDPPDEGALASPEPAPGSPSWADAFLEPSWQEERFVPPPPPPLPMTTTDRLIAWIGVFGSPALLLVMLVLGIRPPSLVNYVLVMGFVGGFLYLVVKMNREPRDPDDNGAVL
ncbi:MAG: hypothetical protein WB471_03325, partial [Nocardioides sp.]